MAITMANLCRNCENTYGMKLIAGSEGLDSYVRWVHLIEDRDVPNFLHGSELVFVTGIGQQSSDDSWLLDFVRKLYDKKAVGLVVNIGPYICAIPKEVIDFCDANKMPLFAIPWSVHLVDIIYDYCHRIVSSEENEVNLANAFRNLIFSPWDRESYYNILDRKDFKDTDSYSVVTIMLSTNEGEVQDFDNKNLRFLVHRQLGKLTKKFSLFNQDKYLICVIDSFTPEQSESFLKELLIFCSSQFPQYGIYAGISPVCNGYMQVASGYTKSVSAVKVALMNKKSICHYSEIGVYKLLLSVQDNEVLNDLVIERLGSLEEFDNKNGTDYVQTLKCYLMNNSSVQEVAKQTFVHRNTINYKIKKIKEILHCELDYDDKLNLMLAFYIRKLLNSQV
ncbi:MAG: PucR family transcriptional regulator ligand-binding domain-containing protein [Acutalibacteraceae bacterium]|nr:PucR family transcriptional regulator ligand-binding domain-containing protein [Acutalibacteraceae bacterium]